MKLDVNEEVEPLSPCSLTDELTPNFINCWNHSNFLLLSYLHRLIYGNSNFSFQISLKLRSFPYLLPQFPRLPLMFWLVVVGHFG
jgi:hypothetical protein